MIEQLQSPDFDSIRQINSYGKEYWSGRELMPLLGYQSWQKFEGAIKRAITACEQAGQVRTDHFIGSVKMIQIGKGGQREVKDYNLSRFACYLTALNGEPSKPEIAAAQAYFVQATRENELHRLAEQQNRRIELRERVAEGNKSLNEAAAQAGVITKHFGTFHDAGYKGLYGGLGVEQVKAHKHINPKEDLLDRAGLEELGANALRIGITERKLRSGEVKGEVAAIRQHNLVGKEIRHTIKRLGEPMPEDLPLEPTIKPLVDERKRARQKLLPKSPAQPQLGMFDEPATPSDED